MPQVPQHCFQTDTDGAYWDTCGWFFLQKATVSC